MMAETAQEITIASDTLYRITKDMSVALSDLLMDMQKHGAGKAQMKAKMIVSLDGSERCIQNAMPSIRHRISFSLMAKDAAGEYVAARDWQSGINDELEKGE